MNRLTLIVVILFLLGLSGISCSKKPAAIVNGEEISLKEFNQKLKQRMESHKVQGADIAESKLKDAVLDEIIGNRLLLQGAREKNINVADKEIDEEIASIKKRLGEDRFNETLKKLGLSQEEHRKQVRERLTINKFIESLVSDDSIKEEDIKKYYKESPTPMMKPERVYVKLIQVPTREEGEKIIKEMKEEGLDFDALGEKLKKENRAVVSDYGWARPDFFRGAIADALRELKEGEYGGPYKGAEGFYLLKVKKREPERVMTYEEAKDQIRQLLLSRKRQAMIAHYISEKRKKAEIKKFIN